MLNIPTLQEQLFPGGNFEGGPGAGPIDMIAATTGEYINGQGGAWHQRMSTHTYAWLIIVGAAGLLVLTGSKFALGPVNV